MDAVIDRCLAGMTLPDAAYRKTCQPAEEYIFEYIVSGRGAIAYGGDVTHVCAGTFCYVRKGIDAVLSSDAAEPYQKIWLNLDGIFVERLTDLFMLGEVFTAAAAEADVMRLFLEILDRTERQTPDNAAETCRQITCLLFELLTEIQKDRFFPDLRDRDTFEERVRAYIDANLYTPLTLDTLSAYFGVTKMHIIRSFKQKFGTTPMQYHAERRLHVAKSLLRGTIMPVGEIAALLCYSNTQHFSSSFKAAVGVTPNEFRKAKE